MLRKDLVVAVVAVFGAVVWILINLPGADQQEADQARIRELEQSVGELQDQLLQADERQRGHYATLLTRIDQLSSSISGSSRALAAGAQGDSEMLEASEHREQTRDEQLRAAVEEGRAIEQRFEDRLRGEIVDASWSGGALTAIDEAFVSPSAEGTRLVASDCRATLCRVDIEHDQTLDVGDREMFENRLIMDLANQFSGGTVTRDGDRSVFYFKRRQEAAARGR